MKKIKIKAQALSTGYYKGSVVRPGQVFEYEGEGKVPSWVKVLETRELEEAIVEETPDLEVKPKRVKKITPVQESTSDFLV